MRKLTSFALAAVVIASTSICLAGNGKCDGSGNCDGAKKRMCKRLRKMRSSANAQSSMSEALKAKQMKQLRKRFDQNGDGKLSTQEKNRMRKALCKQKQNMKQFDTNKDGKLSDEELEAALGIKKQAKQRNGTAW